MMRRREYPLELLCEAAGISTSGWYRRQRHVLSAREHEDAFFQRMIGKLWKKHKGRYGVPRMHAALRQAGFCINKKRVERLMRSNGMRVGRERKRHAGTLQVLAHPEDLVKRQFTAAASNQVWMSDVTEIPTDTGKYYLASNEDAFSRAIVGYAFSAHADTALTRRAFIHALRHRKPKDGLIHHSDRGSHYRSWRYEATVVGAGGRCSYGNTGTPADNACIESFHATLEKEVLSNYHFKTRVQARRVVTAFLNYYNTERLH